MFLKLIFIASLFTTSCIEKKKYNEDAVILKISAISKGVANRGSNLINYEITNGSNYAIDVIKNPNIGYKSDKTMQGYVEIEKMDNGKWIRYNNELNDYNYMNRGETVTLNSGNKLTGVFNIAILFSDFEIGTYRMHMVLKLPLKGGSNSLLTSNWLKFSVD